MNFHSEQHKPIINNQTLLKKLRVHTITDPMQNSSKIAQLKLAKSIYRYICILCMYAATAKLGKSANLFEKPRVF